MTGSGLKDLHCLCRKLYKTLYCQGMRMPELNLCSFLVAPAIQNLILTDNDINEDKKEAEKSDFDSFDGLTRSEETNNSNSMTISLTSKLKEKI